MPIAGVGDRYIQFAFDPSYYRPPKYRSLKTDIAAIKNPVAAKTVTTDLIMDGGNIVYLNNIAIVTDRVFKENKSKSANRRWADIGFVTMLVIMLGSCLNIRSRKNFVFESNLKLPSKTVITMSCKSPRYVWI